MASLIVRRFSLSCAALMRKNPVLLRDFHVRNCSTETSPKLNKETVTVTFVTRDGENVRVQGKENDNLLDIVTNNDLDLEGFGSCGGTLSCSTCHVILQEKDFNRLSGPIQDEELDMLDLAYGLTKTSRLGCQVCVSREFDGLVVQLPDAVRDARNDE